MINFVIMRASQRMLCMDVRVMRGANCWSDHQMVRAKLRIKTNSSRKSEGSSSTPYATYLFHSQSFKDAYRENLTEKLLETPHDSESAAEHNWETLKNCILKSGEEVLVGRAKKTHPDWFVENRDTLQPLIEAKDKAHHQMIQSNTVSRCKEFRKHQRKVKVAVDKAKEEWITRTAQEGEKAVKDGRTRWKSIRKLQMAHAGRRPSRPTAVLKEDGELTKTPEQVRSCWHRHLNVPSVFCEQVVDSMT